MGFTTGRNGRRWVAAVAVGLALSVVGGDLAFAEQVGSAPVEEVADPGFEVEAGDADADPRDLPSVASTAEPAEDEAPGDFSVVPGGPMPAGWEAPGATGFVEGESVEVPSLTTETKRVFENPDGSFTEELSPSPVRFRDEAGAWQEYDLALEAASGEFVPEAAPEGDAVAAMADAAALAQTVTDAGVVALEHSEAEAVAGEVDGSTGEVTYEGAVDGDADLVVKLVPGGFETTVVVPDGDPERASFKQELTVPAGVTARDGGPGVELVDGSGAVIGAYGSGIAFDAAERRVEAPVLTRLVGQSGTSVTVSVAVDPTWLADPARVFPVAIDPTFTQNTAASGAMDTYVQSNIAVTSQSAADRLKIGQAWGTSFKRRALLKFDTSSVVGPNRLVTSASLQVFNIYSPSCTARAVEVRELASAFNTATVWSNQPTWGPTTITSSAFAKGYNSSCPAGGQSIDIKPLAQRWVDGVANHGVAIKAVDEADDYAGKEIWSGETIGAATLSITYNRPPTGATLKAPAAAATVRTTQPRLELNPGTDPDGNPLQYWWAVSTEPGNGGQILASGWKDPRPDGQVWWDVPAGSLVDGGTYYWSAYTWDGLSWPAGPAAERSFTVDLRLGDSGVWPTDELGPAKVNLTTGNLVVSTGSPTFSTVGGGIGVSYTYNSQGEATGGLTGSYYSLPDPVTHRPAASASPAAVRRDRTLSFDWKAGSPSSAMGGDQFYAGWEGWYLAEVAGTYKVGGTCSNGAMKVVLGSAVLDRWTSGCSTSDTWSAAVTLAAGQVVPIKAEYWHSSGNAAVNVKVQTPGAPAGINVPAASLSATAAALPTGWSLSADVDGATAYRSVEVTDAAVTFTDTEETAHRYPWDAVKKAWQPPAGEYGVVGKAADGAITLLEADGSAYVFAKDGTLRSVTSALDDSQRAAAILTWEAPVSGAPLRLTSINDPASSSVPADRRRIELAYAGDPRCSTGAGGGLAPAPAGMLCAVDYGDFSAGVSYLRYDANGYLVRIEDPGGEVTDFGYTTGRITTIRDPLAADAVAAGIRADDNTTKTLVGYGTGVNAALVASLTAPAPRPGEAQPKHSYAYDAGSTEVDADGLTSTAGWLRKVVYDDRGRVVLEADQASRLSFTVWDAQDRALSTIDAATGLKSTSVYDEIGNLTDEWGPAPTSWWSAANATGAPLAAKQALTPHEVNGTDEGIGTLAATWWDNADWSGTPKARTTRVTPTTPEITGSWGTGAPAAVGSAARFSGRFTGYVKIATAGSWAFNASGLVGTFRLSIDNTLVIDETRTTAGSAAALYAAATAGWKPITIDFADSPASTASFALQVKPGGTGTYANVPTASLNPGYGLGTSAVDADGNRSTTAYADPTNGLATATTVDPAGLALASTTSYESTYRREESRQLPLGAASTIATTYYGSPEAGPAGACSAAGVNQAGMSKTITSANPDGSGPSGIARTTAYDAQARPVATRVGTEPWTCTTYDARGRVTEVVVPGVSGMVGHTTTNVHAVAGNPLATSVTEVDATGGATPFTVTTVVDLLGRVREYEDAWGNVTTTSYDQVGRTTQVDSPLGVETMTYDANGNAGPTVLDGVTLATPHYDSAGRLDWVAYANGVKSDPVARDDLGRETGTTWRRISDGTVLATESSTSTLGGKLVELSTDGNDPRPGGPNYVYDRAGRLTEAWTTTRDAAGTIGSQHTTYGFGPAAGTCAAGTQASAGKNTNRTSQTVGDGAGAVTTTYCYDAADRLTSTSEAGVGSIAYDAHGNTTGIWGETRSYDASDRHVATSKAGVTVSYRRDASGRIISRSSSAAGGSEQRYGFTGDTDSPDLVLDATGATVEQTIGLAGGATLTKRDGSEVWSLSNLHGDNTVVTDGAGVVAGPSRTYAPSGPTTGQPIVDNSDGRADYGWLGKHQRLTEHEAGFAQTIEMGARQYDPTLGRFLEVDPIEGGSANDYDYADGDPVNRFDLDGRKSGGSSKSDPGNSKWCKKSWRHPSRANQCRRANRAKVWAVSRSTARGKGHPGRTNALRHCMWSALMRADMGRSAAQGFLTRHEGHSKKTHDHYVDLRNNQVGLRIGGRYGSRRRIERACVGALNSRILDASSAG